MFLQCACESVYGRQRARQFAADLYGIWWADRQDEICDNPVVSLKAHE